MNTNIFATRPLLAGLLVLVLRSGAVSGQTTLPPGTPQPDSSGYVCVARGPNSKVWQRTILYTSPEGIVTTMRQSYTELATGLCYLSSSGIYVDSVEEVDPVPGGAQAIQGRHQVNWSLNANTHGGAVVVITSDGKRLSSTVLGIAYYDLATGSNATIASLKDCDGAIAPPNQVIYADAFTNMTADIYYTYTKAGLSQDVVLRQSLPTPDSCGLSDETSLFQIYTEFFASPEPEMTAVTNGNVVDSPVLDFGDMKMGMGETLFLNAQDTPVTAGTTTKQWVHVNNRTFLVESIPYLAISNQLKQLPHTSNLKPGRASVRRMALMESQSPRPRSSAKAARPMKLAKAETTQPRLEADYSLLSSSTNLILQSDSTYFVTGTVNNTGTLTIEGGTCVKYTNSSSAQIIATNIVCQTQPCLPGVFTSMNDDAVGATITGSSHTPTQGQAVYLNFGALGTSSLVFRGLRFSYAAFGIYGTLNGLGGNSIAMWDCQFINCQSPFYGNVAYPTNSFGTGFPINAYNTLFSRCSDGLIGSIIAPSSGYLLISLANVTADQVGTFSVGAANACYAKNSLFTATGMSGSFFLTSCCTNATNTGIYQTVGSGSYYLAAGSTNRNACTTSDPTLLADLQTKATWPPFVYSNATITSNLTLSPYATRDTNGTDRGYHYDALDYAFGGSTAGGNLTFAAGTAVGWFRTSSGWEHAGQGIHVADTMHVSFQGTESAPDYWVRANTVQEGGNAYWNGGYGTGGITGWATVFANAPTVQMTFTHCSVVGWGGMDGHFRDDYGYLLLNLTNCQFSGSFVSGYITAGSMTNCLFARTGVGDVQTDPNTYFNLQNCTVKGASISALTSFNMHDCALDGSLFFTNTGTGTNVFDYNAFVNGAIETSPKGAHDLIVTNFAWVAGPLGNYYQPANGPLLHQGGVPAPSVGLYHYTTTTNEAIEGTNIVSIGFHYVALGTNGLPLVSNTNGVPDYLADANGNGIVDNGELPWIDAPGIVTQPVGVTNFWTSNVTFTVAAQGTMPMYYQWSWNGTNLSGATNSSLTLLNVQFTNDGSCVVVITNIVGSVTSSVATLTVYAPPTILSTTPQGPGPFWVNNGGATLSVLASDADLLILPLTYGWYSNGINLPWLTLPTYGVGTNIDINYTVGITNPLGSTSVTWNLLMAFPGMVEAWGSTNSGECNRPMTLTNATAIAAGEYQSVAVADSGTVSQWGQYWDGTNLYSVATNIATQPPPASSNLVAVAAGIDHVLGLTASGAVLSWGMTNSAANNVPTSLNLTNVSEVGCGWAFNAALRSNGTIVAWGNDLLGQTSVPAALTNGVSNVLAIATGAQHSLALLSSGTVVAWGHNGSGQLNVPTGLTNVVAVAAGDAHSMALDSNGKVWAWGSNASNQTNVPAAASTNVMAIAAGGAHSVALLNNGTVVAWGDNSKGQTNVPAPVIDPRFPITVKLIAAGGNHTMAAIFSSFVQYPVNVSKDLLLIYNTNSLDSSNVYRYYLTNRPMVSNANVLGIGCITYETFLPSDYTNVFVMQLTNWLAANPTKRPSYVIIFPNIPSRVNVTTNEGVYNEQGPGSYFPSVQYQLHNWCSPGWFPFVTAINMNGTNGAADCTNYINKLTNFASTYSPGQLFISASGGGYSNSNWYFDYAGSTNFWCEYADGAEQGVTNVDPTAAVFGSSYFSSRATNVAGYFTGGYDEFQDAHMFVDSNVTFNGASKWYIMTTIDSLDGERDTYQAGFLSWFATNSFGGTNYSNTPVGAVTTVDEPYVAGKVNPNVYYGDWAAGKSFAISAWAAQIQGNGNEGWYFQAIGDPFVRK